MIFFSYTRIVAKISLIPLIIVGVIGYIVVKDAHTIAVGLVHALIGLAIWCGISFGTVGGLVTAIALLGRKGRRHYRNRTARAVSTERDIPVISYRLNPEPVAEIENKAGQGVTINGLTMDEYNAKYRRLSWGTQKTELSS